MAQTLSVVMKVEGVASELVTAKGHKAQVAALYKLFNSLLSGGKHANIDVYSSTSAPVAASGSIALTYANIDADDTVTIGGVVLTAKASGANGTTQFNKQTNAATTAANLAACINANPTLSKHVLASANGGTVTVTAKLKGSIGNLIVMSTSDATAFSLTQMTGGAGGAEGTAQNYSVGI